jgi:3',5'-cyclic AMP phosphodiesterase CpdA
MKAELDRREFLKLSGLGAVVLACDLGGWGSALASAQKDFFFVQLSDTHIGFNDPKVNPDYAGTLAKAVAQVNGLKRQPDFVVFTGDLTHTTDDDNERRKRLAQFKKIASSLKVKNVRFLPGEHDAALDNAKAYMEFFGQTHYVFSHKGVNFIALDNVSDPHSQVGEAQLQWLGAELKRMDKKTPIVVLTHRPLFPLYPDWDWDTKDSDKVLDLLAPYQNVTVLYGHIHQLNDKQTGQIYQHAAHGLMYPLPAPGSVPKKAPIPWDPAQPYKDLGFRGVTTKPGPAQPELGEYPVKGA